MEVALDACRASAASGKALTFEELASWQAIVLGASTSEPPRFRTTTAFAKQGRERYGITEETKAQFESALRDASDASLPLWFRAARVYLDVCFFHPFDDGNARAARLALDHTLTREGYGLHSAEPLFMISRGAERWALPTLTSLVDYLMGTQSR